MSFTDIEQFLPNDPYQAAIGAASPSAINVFATMADLASVGGETLAQTLVLGNTTGGTDMIVSLNDDIQLNDNNTVSGTASKLIWNADNYITYDEGIDATMLLVGNSNIEFRTNSHSAIWQGSSGLNFTGFGVGGNLLPSNTTTSAKTWTLPDANGTVVVNGYATVGDIILGNGFDLTYTSGSFTNNIRTELLSDNRTIDFPDATGVLALTVDTLQGGNQALPVGTRTITLGGNLSTDNLIVETNGGTTVLNIRGDKTFFIGNNISSDHRITASDEGAFAIRAATSTKTGMGSLVWNTGSTQTQFFSDNWVDATTQANSTYWRFTGKNSSGTSQPVYVGANGGLHVITGTLETHGTTASNFIAIQNGTAPTTDRVDKAVIYAADEAAGNSCIHARTEQGEIIKLYQEAALTTQLTTITFTGPTVADYALQDVTNTSPWGFADAEELRTFISVVENLQVRMDELETRQQNQGFVA